MSYQAPPPPPPPQPGGYGQAYGTPPKNNMAMAVIALILGLCGGSCIGLITGIVSVVYASQVNGKFARGDVAGAQQSAASARTWAIVTFVIVVIAIVLTAVLYATGVLKVGSSVTVN